MHCASLNCCSCCLEICILRCELKESILAWCEPLSTRFKIHCTVGLRPKLVSTATIGIPDD